MQITTAWKRGISAAGGIGSIAALALAWQQLDWPTPAWSSDLEKLQTGLERRIDGLERVLLYRERERVEDKIDELERRARRDPGNLALQELIRLTVRERDEIDRQIDALQ